jgi:hypothetical protein
MILTLITLKLHVFVNAFQTQILSKYTSLADWLFATPGLYMGVRLSELFMSLATSERRRKFNVVVSS